MKIKLHFAIVVVILAFLGAFMDQKTVPNQQIVVQFLDKSVSIEDSEKAIESIQYKLQSIGVTHIQIGQNRDGQLRITYHSDSEVSQIQDVLFKADGFDIAYHTSQQHSNNFPKDKEAKDYELNISEIKSDSNFNWDFEGTQVTEVNQKTDHSNQLQVNYSGKPFNTKPVNNIVNVAVAANNTVVNAIGRLSYKIPEVRAGPIS
ncbi:hypothetical protein [Winogradskyella sp. Asnod2-B02-A]|uniref:hypothetical protein n=1 Tax=Winogradskyella sp. Asnod2-B02-A TaxID=3160583 RepID=UPI003869E432